MTSFNKYCYIFGTSNHLHNISNITSYSFLKLQSFRYHICYSSYLTKTYYSSIWNISNCYLHIIHKSKMMLTITENIYIFYHYHIGSSTLTFTFYLFRLFFIHIQCKCFVKHIRNFFICIIHSIKNFFIHFCNSFRCIF